jgi:hypothetical protein
VQTGKEGSSVWHQGAYPALWTISLTANQARGAVMGRAAPSQGMNRREQGSGAEDLLLVPTSPPPSFRQTHLEPEPWIFHLESGKASDPHVVFVL